MMSYISSFEIINFFAFNPKIFCWIPASAADDAAINRNGLKTLLANTLNTFFIKTKQVFSNGPISLPRNLTDCAILDI